MYKFVSNITFKSDTYQGNQEYNPPLKFDNQKYNYYIKLLNVRFSNNVPNVKTVLKLYSDNVEIASVGIGIYEVSDLVELVNSQQSILKFTLNNANGHMTIKNIDTAQHTFSGNLLSSIQCGKFQQTVTLQADETSDSPKMCQVTDFNFFKLTSSIINPAAYESQNGKLVTTNTLYTFAATISPFGHKDFCAFENICYPLGMDQLQFLDFNLVDENGNQLPLLTGSKSDFNIQAVIVKELKK